MALNEKGHEVLDDTPVAMPVGFKRPQSMTDMIRQYVRTELSKQASEQGNETWEEADDFDVGDDYDPKSPWELTFDQEMAISQQKAMTQEKPAETSHSDVSESKPDSGAQGQE